MRQRGRFAFTSTISFALLALLTPVAHAANVHGPKVDDRVALAASAGGPSAQLPVIVFGTSAVARDTSLRVRQAFGLAFAGTVESDQLDALAADPQVAYIAPNVAVAPLAQADRTDGGRGTNNGGKGKGLTYPKLAALYPTIDDAPAAWEKGYTGAGVGIAVVDSGVTGGTLGGRLIAKVGPNNGSDKYGHGTLVAHFAAGDASGEYVGIAPQANVIAVSVDRPDGTYTSDVLAALLWVLENKSTYNIRVVNLSLTETTPSSYDSSVLDTAVELLWRSGVVVVTSAGNLGPGSAVFAPANDPFVISVGATDANGTTDPADDTLAPWSTWGTTLDGFAKPELVAPGRLVAGYLPEGTPLGQEAPTQNWVQDSIVKISGTSFSAPQVAGAAAVLLQQHPDWTPDQIKAVLALTGRPQQGSTAPALDLGAATSYHGNPPPANGGIQYSSFGLPQWVYSLLSGATWLHNSWNADSWNHNSWNAADWDHNSWNTDGWDHNSWNHNSWNDGGWD
jgi:serine protease AprX